MTIWLFRLGFKHSNRFLKENINKNWKILKIYFRVFSQKGIRTKRVDIPFCNMCGNSKLFLLSCPTAFKANPAQLAASQDCCKDARKDVVKMQGKGERGVGGGKGFTDWVLGRGRICYGSPVLYFIGVCGMLIQKLLYPQTCKLTLPTSPHSSHNRQHYTVKRDVRVIVSPLQLQEPMT